MLLKKTTIETSRRKKHAIISALHSGTVDSGLSSPFKNNVKPDTLFSPQQSAAYLLNVVNTLKTENSGKVFAWDGQEITP